MSRPLGALQKEPEPFFNRDWWAGAAIRLRIHFPKAIRVIERGMNCGAKPDGAGKHWRVVSWKISYAFLARRVGPCLEFDPLKKIADKKLMLLYCLYHQQMTEQALQIAEASNTLFRFFTGLYLLERDKDGMNL